MVWTALACAHAVPGQELMRGKNMAVPSSNQPDLQPSVGMTGCVFASRLLAGSHCQNIVVPRFSNTDEIVVGNDLLLQYTVRE